MRLENNGSRIVHHITENLAGRIAKETEGLVPPQAEKSSVDITCNYVKGVVSAVTEPVLSELEKLFDKLEMKGRTVIKWANTDEIEVVLYKGKRHDYFRSRDGKIFRVRYSKDDNLNQTLKQISEEYAKRGIITPEMELVTINGMRGVASRLLTDLSDKSENPHAAYMSFGTDVLFGHRNAYSKGVTMINSNGQVVKVSTSGCANYRVRGEKRYDFGSEPTELRTFLDPAINKESAEFLKDMTREEMIQSIGNAVEDCAPRSLPGVDYKDDVMLVRRQFLIKFMNIAMLMPQHDGESLLNYVDRVIAKVKSIDSENAYYTQKLMDYVNSLPVASSFDWNGFRQQDKDLALKMIEEIKDLDELPKSMYLRQFSADDFKKLVELRTKNRDTLYFSNPATMSRIIYNPNKSVQCSIDDLYHYSLHYRNESCRNGSERLMTLEKNKFFLDKYLSGEISFEDLVNYAGVLRNEWQKINERNLLEPIAGMSTPLNPRIVVELSRLNDEQYANLIQRPELLVDIPNRSEPLDKFAYELSKIDDEVYQKLLSRHILEDLEPHNHKQLFKFDDAITLAKLDDETYQKAINRGLLKHHHEYDTTYNERGWSDYGSDLSASEIEILAQLSDEQFSRLLKLGLFSPKYKDYFNRQDLYKSAEFTDSDFEIFRKMGILNGNQLDIKEWNVEILKEFLTLSDYEKYVNVPMLMTLEIPVYERKYYSSHEKELKYMPIPHNELAQYASLPESNLNRLRSILRNKTLAEKLAKTDNLFAAVSCDEATWNNILKRGILSENSPFPKDYSIIGTISNFEKNEFPDEYVLNLLGKISDEKWEFLKQKGFINGDPTRPQFNGEDLYRISQLSDEDFTKFMRTGLFDNNLDFKFDPKVDGGGYEYGNFVHPKWLLEALQELSIDEIDTLAKRNIFKGFKVDNELYRDGYYNLDTLKAQYKLTDKQFTNYKKIFENEPTRSTLVMTELSKLPDEQLQRILDRRLVQYSSYYEGESDYRAGINIVTKLSELNDREWEFAYRLFDIYTRIGFENKVYGPTKTIVKLIDFCKGRKFLYEFSLKEKKELLTALIKTGGVECSSYSIGNLIPEGTIIPKTFYKRQIVLNDIIESVGLNTKKLTDNEITDFKEFLSEISKPDSAIMKTDFDRMIHPPRLLYARQKFEIDFINKIKDLDKIEKHKLFEYFSFEIEETENGLKMVGYPSIPTNYKKADLLDNPKTRQIAEQLTIIVDKFTNGNKIICEDNPELECELNNIVKVFPEFLTTVGKVQHGTHHFTVDLHTIKVLQSIMSDPRYQELSDNDKLIMQLSGLLHDITKEEKMDDRNHPADSAFDAYYLIDRLNLSREDKLKCYEIIRNHDWLERLNKPVFDKVTGERRPLNEYERNRILQQIAFAHRQNDCFKMASILTQADLKGVKRNNEFFDKYKSAYEYNVKAVQSLINVLKTTAIHIPQTRIPKASQIIVDGEIAKTVTSDGISNIVLYLKPGQDLSKIGFDIGVISDELNFLVHALDYEEQSTVFKALGFVDSDALLSTSWINYQKGNYKVFRQQGYILKVDSDDIHAGSYKDFGSGYKKDYNTLLKEYLFGLNRHETRKYWSDCVKKEFGLSDEEYVRFNETIRNKSFNEIKLENPEVAQKLQNIVDEMDVKRRAGGRNYNEWLISRPEIQGAFFWGKYYDKLSGNSREYKLEDVPLFIREYCAQNDLPIIFFGE